MAALLIILLAVAADIMPDAERAILEQFYNGTVGTDKWKQGCDGGWATGVFLPAAGSL